MAEAARWYHKAADQGYALAQFNLARLYHAGAGVPQDDAEAKRWLRKAADQGYEMAILFRTHGDKNNRSLQKPGSGLTPDNRQRSSSDARYAEEKLAHHTKASASPAPTRAPNDKWCDKC
jgi:TPR repeat protein